MRFFFTHTMNLPTFLTAIKTLTGLAPEMQEYLAEIAADLTDAQRRETVDTLTPISDALVVKQEALATQYRKNAAEIDKYMKEKLPALRKSQESLQRTSDAQRVEESLQTL